MIFRYQVKIQNTENILVSFSDLQKSSSFSSIFRSSQQLKIKQKNIVQAVVRDKSLGPNTKSRMPKLYFTSAADLIVLRFRYSTMVKNSALWLIYKMVLRPIARDTG